MDSDKVQAPKARKDKKKNTETGLLMGQNTNIFSQLSATYLQSKQSATQQEANFVNSTQIIQYHDPNINRLIALLRKKADVTKAKAAVQLREQISKMSEENIQQFIQTFSHLFMEIVINEQSKQVIDQFVAMINFVFTNFKKIAIKEVATIFGPLLVIYKSNNISQSKAYSLLFTGTQQQMQQKAIILLLSKNVMKKFLVFCRLIIECEQVHKIGQQNFQRNCSSLLKVIKQFIKSYQNMTDKKQQIVNNFGKFIFEISDIVSGKFAQQYFKVGGKAKGSFLQFYQVLISEFPKHPQWKIDWQNYAKTICQNYLDKDNLVQQTLWKYCNKQFIKSSLEIQQTLPKEEGKEREKYWILHKYLPKPDQKLLSVLKLGGLALYKQLPSYCTVFPYTTFQPLQTHKSLINKISFIRKLMQSILEQQDENEARMQCYYQIASNIIPLLRTCSDFGKELDQKKKQQVKTLALKTQKQIINNIQDRYYKNPPSSRNSFTFNVPTYFCKLLSEIQPTFDFLFDPKQTFLLYSSLKNQNNSEYVRNVFDKIYQSCKNDLNLTVQYLENFPSKSINIDMSESNPKIEESAKIFLLSTQATNQQNWFKQNWDIRKSAVVFDPRISQKDIKSFQQSHSYYFKPSNRSQGLQNIYIKQQHDQKRFKYFLRSLQDEQQIAIVPLMLPLIKDILLQRSTQNKVKYLNQILSLHQKNVDFLSKKQWVVSQTSILRLRATCDIIIQGLKGLDIQDESFKNLNRQLLQKFLVNYCLFVQNTFNYKLEAQSEQLLKQIPKILSYDFNSKHIFQSVRKTIKSVFQSFNKITQKQITEGEDKQRKNRLLRALGFVRKLLWYGINKKKQEYYVRLVQDILQIQEWKNCQFRPDLWMLLESIIEVADSSVKRKIAGQIIKQYQKYKYFIAILMCCQLVLPLQRHPSTKKVIIQLQNEVLKKIKEINDSELNIKILTALINQTLSNQSMFLIYGVKNLLKNLMKHYQNISAEHLKLYQTEVLEKQLISLKANELNFNKKCLLTINICAELPLLDFQQIDKIYENLVKTTINQQDSVKVLGYLAIIGTIWDSSVGVDKTTQEFTIDITKKFSKSLKDTLGKKSDQNNNFVRYFGLTFLNSLLQIKTKESLNDDWQFIILNLVLAPVKQGSLLHGAVQSCRYKGISKIFSMCPEKLKNQLVTSMPQQILKEVKFYKQILDQIEDEDDRIQEQTMSNNHHENITNMFIQFAEVLVRITTCLTKQTKPDQRLILELLQCLFPGIKKTSFILLKQMYELNFVSKMPPAQFINYLKLNPQILKSPLEPTTANIISSYLYSWQALINRRGAIQKSSQDQNSLTLQDYLQNEQLHQSFLKNVFQILETHLEYSKNQQQYEIESQELIDMDSIVNIQDDFNLHNKVFRLIVRTLFMFVENFPLFIRDFVDKNKKFKNICEKLLRNVISDAIFKEEITKIEMKEQQWKSAGNFEIYVIPKNKEIYAEYTHDVIRIGLRLSMKSNYPLTPIVIQFGQGLKIEDGSRWALMLQTQLHSRNNTIINGILLWKDNIDKKLAGVEQCSICFDIVNGSGHLPKKGCKTCKKKFHSACIMKWFSKSNKSQCPLCKSQFL